jgi:transcriptional regulator with XRE-family HTH domain
MKDREFRAAFNLENVYTTICFQLRALREQRVLSQGEFGKRVTPKMAQERISILEDPNADSKPTLNTLIRLADAADVGLDVRFVPFSLVLSRAVNTEMRCLEVDSFTDEFPRLEQEIDFEAGLESSQTFINNSISAAVLPFRVNSMTASANRPTAIGAKSTQHSDSISAGQTVGY